MTVQESIARYGTIRKDNGVDAGIKWTYGSKLTFDNSKGKPRTWITTLARNRAIDRIRSNGRRSRLRESASNEAAVAGIEPATKRLTVALPYQNRTHRNVLVRMAGFEPAVSCFRNTRDARLPHVLFSRAPSGSRTHTSAMARQ